MILIERTAVMNLENAMRGARNPLASWAKSDSAYNEADSYLLGKQDLQLAKKLCRAGSDHRKFMRQILVSVDITAPLYFWKEFDTYKVATTANSTSTMHTIHKKAFSLDDFSTDQLRDLAKEQLTQTVAYLEKLRQEFVKTKDKAAWYDIIQLLPSSYQQLRTVTLNYETLISIYHSRKQHKLAEWREFCNWIGTLPYGSELITMENEGEV